MKKIMDKAILTSAFILGAMKVGTTDVQAAKKHHSDRNCDKHCDEVVDSHGKSACHMATCGNGCMGVCARTGKPFTAHDDDHSDKDHRA